MSKQYWIKVKFGNTQIEVKEISAETSREALMIASSYGKAMIEVEAETKEQTEYRMLNKAWNELDEDQDNLREFLYDDIGFSIEELGQEKFNELDAKYEAQAVKLAELREKMMDWEIENN